MLGIPKGALGDFNKALELGKKMPKRNPQYCILKLPQAIESVGKSTA